MEKDNNGVERCSEECTHKEIIDKVKKCIIKNA